MSFKVHFNQTFSGREFFYIDDIESVINNTCINYLSVLLKAKQCLSKYNKSHIRKLFLLEKTSFINQAIKSVSKQQMVYVYLVLIVIVNFPLYFVALYNQ